ncbi:MAG: universal stress protein [Alphaproteobacteria bacterium]
MTVRTILVPVRGDGKGEGVLDHALSFARRYSAHLDVIHCRPRPEDLLPFGVSVPAILKKDILASAGTLADEEERKVKSQFGEYCANHQLTVIDAPPGPPDRVTVSWRERMGKQAAIVGLYGRLADLTAVAQPDRQRNLGLNTLEAALLETGRLVLMCPPKPPGDIGTRVALCWNGSSEVSRAITAALPILKSAEAVTLLCASESKKGALGPEDGQAYLTSHGIACGIKTTAARASKTGQALLAGAKEAGADVLLMGAYGQSRRRELVLGGVTQHIIDYADLPILLMH